MKKTNPVKELKKLLHIPETYNGQSVIARGEISATSCSCDVIVCLSPHIEFDLNIYVINQNVVEEMLFDDPIFFESLRLLLNSNGFLIKSELFRAESGMQSKSRVVVELNQKQVRILFEGLNKKGIKRSTI